MYFTIIIPTRNRYKELSVCLSHILEQSFTDYEVLIIDDGSNLDISNQYPKIIPSDRKFKLINQGSPTIKGMGASATRNIGLAEAQGNYIAFCDDDDFWTDNDHLLIAHNTLSNGNIDMYIANQSSINPSGKIKHSDWFPHLSENKKKYINISKKKQTYLLDVKQLLNESEIPQLNTLILKKTICGKIDGFWSELTNLEDRDFYLRALEHCYDICFRQHIVSQHNSPAGAKRKSISNSISNTVRHIQMIMVLNHVLLNTNRIEIIVFCKRFLGEEYRDLTLITENQLQLMYADIALTSLFSLKWFVYTRYLKLRSIINFFFKKT